MTIVLTICSINYLAQAKTLHESLLRHNPGFQFVVGLVDTLEGISFEPAFAPDFELIPVAEIQIPYFERMCKNYDITELNTAVKPYFMEYLYEKYQAQNVIYFDPDIIVYQPLSSLLEDLQRHSIVLTPHICSPIHDTFSPSEFTHTQTGIFNLGFMATAHTPTTQKMLHWWQEKLAEECRIDLENGLFVDQKWIDLAPHYFDNILTNKYLGYNMAYWNLHERRLSKNKQGEWVVNNEVPLIFFHFSGYGLNRPNDISKYQNRYTFAQRPDIQEVFGHYAQCLEANGNEYFRQFACAYIKPAKVIRLKRIRKFLKKPFEIILGWL